MNLDHLKVFIDLAETLNFRKAAEREHISQPAVSQAIKSIENEIGVKLFKRSRSGVTITKDGEVFYHDIKPLLNSYYKSVQQVQRLSKNDKSNLTIGLTATPHEQQFLPKILPPFCQKHPKIKFFLQNDSHDQLTQQLLNEDCDVIFTTKDDIINYPQINYTELLTGSFCAVVPKINRLSSKTKLEIEDFNQNNLILLDNNWCPPEQLKIQEKIRKTNDQADLAYVSNVSTAYMMCTAGLGVSIMPTFIAGHPTDLVNIIPINSNPELSYGVASLTDNKNFNVTEFKKYLCQKMVDH